MSARGANKTEARKALEEAIERQCAHMHTRRYLSANDVTFVLFYSDGLVERPLVVVGVAAEEVRPHVTRRRPEGGAEVGDGGRRVLDEA